MARRRQSLQLLALAAAVASLLLLPAVHATPPSPDDASAAAVSHAAPRSVDDAAIHGPRNRLLSDDVHAYADADAPAASSSSTDASDGDPHARSPSGDDSTLLKFLWRVFGPVIFFLVAFSVVGAVAVLVVLLLKFSGFAAAYVGDRCASAWRSVKEARKKAARVRPVDEDAAGA